MLCSSTDHSISLVNRYTCWPATPLSKTGAERPPKRDSKFDPFRTTGAKRRIFPLIRLSAVRHLTHGAFTISIWSMRVAILQQ
jgi:hypothetical protein